MQDTQEKQFTLQMYLKEKKLSMFEFSRMTGISVPSLYRMSKNRDYNATIDHVRAIYHATEQRFGEGLDCWQYLNR